MTDMNSRLKLTLVNFLMRPSLDHSLGYTSCMVSLYTRETSMVAIILRSSNLIAKPVGSNMMTTV